MAQACDAGRVVVNGSGIVSFREPKPALAVSRMEVSGQGSQPMKSAHEVSTAVEVINTMEVSSERQRANPKTFTLDLPDGTIGVSIVVSAALMSGTGS